jgi:hypothetical protein
MTRWCPLELILQCSVKSTQVNPFRLICLSPISSAKTSQRWIQHRNSLGFKKKGLWSCRAMLIVQLIIWSLKNHHNKSRNLFKGCVQFSNQTYLKNLGTRNQNKRKTKLKSKTFKIKSWCKNTWWNNQKCNLWSNLWNKKLLLKKEMKFLSRKIVKFSKFLTTFWTSLLTSLKKLQRKSDKCKRT